MTTLEGNRCFKTEVETLRVGTVASAVTDAVSEVFTYACGMCQSKVVLLAAVMLIKQHPMTSCTREAFLEMAGVAWDSVQRLEPPAGSKPS